MNAHTFLPGLGSQVKFCCKICIYFYWYRGVLQFNCQEITLGGKNKLLLSNLKAKKEALRKGFKL